MTSETTATILFFVGALALALVALALRQRRVQREKPKPAPATEPTPEMAVEPAAVEMAAPVLAATQPEPMVLTPLAAEPVGLEPIAVEPAAMPAAPVAISPAPVMPAPPPPKPEPAPAPKPAVEPPAPGEPVEIVRVLRERPQGPLIVEMGGHRYRRVTEIKDQSQGLSLVDVVIDLQQFIGIDVIAPLAAEKAAEPPAHGAPPGPAPVMRPSMNPIKQMFILREREMQKSREKDAGPQPSSIVEEIEALLVKRLIGSPYEGRSIHMRPGLHGGAHIDVDGRAYESIEDIADTEVKSFLKTVIAEWERGPQTREAGGAR